MIKSKFYRIVLWIILLSMGGGTLLFSPLFYKQVRSARPVLLTVNGQEITNNQYEKQLMHEYENLDMIRKRYGEYADSFLKLLGMDNPQELAIKKLVNNELINQVADQLNMNLSSQFVMQKLYDPAFVVNELRDIVPIQVLDQTGAINMPALSYWLQRTGQTMGDFEEALEDALKRKMVTDLLGSAIYISPEQAKDYFSSNFLKKKYEILSFPFSNYLKQVKTEPIPSEELEKYFNEENQAHKTYWIPEKRSATLWRFSPKDYEIEVSSKEIESYYNKNKQDKFLDTPVQMQIRRILFAVQEGVAPSIVMEKAKKVYEELKENPDRFEKLAQEYSEDKETAQKGGDIGFIKRGDRDPAFWRAALRLQKDGEISEIVQTQDGFEILQRVAKKLSQHKPLERVEKDIRDTILRQKFRQKFTQDAESAIADLKENKAKLDDFVALKKGKKESIANETFAENPFTQKLFKTKKGQWGVFVDKAGIGNIFIVDQIDKAHEPVLSEVKERVEQDLYAKKAQKALKEAMSKAEVAAKRENLKSIADQMGLELKATDWLKKDDSEKLEKLEKEGIPYQRLFFKSERVGSVTSAMGKRDGYLAKLESVEPFDWVIYKDKKDEAVKNLFQERKDLQTRAFIDSLNKNAKIEHKEQQGATRQIPLDDIF